MKKILLVLLVVVAGTWIACRVSRKEEPKPAARTESTAPKGIPQAEAVSGSALNKAFPKATGDLKLTFTQEKDGFAQADLSKGGTKLATLSVSDTDANPGARDKFKASTRKIGGHPAASVGSLGTAVLVADRYQVQVRSVAPSFTEGDRTEWIEKFDLNALAAIRK